MIRKGCQGYLAYVVETENERILVDEIPVAREFPDVFPDDIAGDECLKHSYSTRVSPSF